MKKNAFQHWERHDLHYSKVQRGYFLILSLIVLRNSVFFRMVSHPFLDKWFQALTFYDKTV